MSTIEYFSSLVYKTAKSLSFSHTNLCSFEILRHLRALERSQMEQRSKYQLSQPRDSLNTTPFFIDLNAANKNANLLEHERVQLNEGGNSPSVVNNSSAFDEIELTPSGNSTRHPNKTNIDQSNEKEKKERQTVQKKNSPQQTTTTQKTRTSGNSSQDYCIDDFSATNWYDCCHFFNCGSCNCDCDCGDCDCNCGDCDCND